jgi:hypothetical protein
VRCVEASSGSRGPDAPGLPILQAIANAAHVKVMAAVDAQRADGSFRYEGAIVSVQPATAVAP